MRWWDGCFEFVQHSGNGSPIGVDKRMPVNGWNRSRSCYGPVKKYLQLPAGRLGTGGAEPECVAQANGGTGAGGSSPVTAATGPKTPLMVASVGTYSGPLGMFMLTHLSGPQVCVKRTKRAGGLVRSESALRSVIISILSDAP